MPVEDELVLATDEIAERQVRARVAGPRDEHLLALFRLAHVVRRRGKIDDELCTGEGEICGGRPRLPQVLADRRPGVDLRHAQKQEVAAFGEVAVLVEDAVVREKVLSIDPLHATVRAHRAGIREVTVEPRCSDERDDSLGGPSDLLERVV